MEGAGGVCCAGFNEEGCLDDGFGGTGWVHEVHASLWSGWFLDPGGF